MYEHTTRTQMTERVQRRTNKRPARTVCSERPSVSDETFTKVKEAIPKDQRVSFRELSEMIPNVSKTSVNQILTDYLGHVEVCTKWVPRMVTEDD